MSKEKKHLVTILNRRDISIAVKLGEYQTFKRVNYVTSETGMGTIRVPLDDYSAELEAELIRKDIERKLDEIKETIEV